SRPHPASRPTAPATLAPTTNCRRLKRFPRRSIGGPSLGGIIPLRADGVKRRSSHRRPRHGPGLSDQDSSFPTSGGDRRGGNEHCRQSLGGRGGIRGLGLALLHALPVGALLSGYLGVMALVVGALTTGR